MTRHPSTSKAARPALQRACEEFETSFIKQLLHAAKIGGKDAATVIGDKSESNETAV